QGIVEPDFSCRTDSPATLLDSPAPEYPHSAGGVRRPALVITVLTIGADGLARDPEILLALPGEGFAASAVEAWLNSRFAPANGAVWLRHAADGGSAAAQLILAVDLLAGAPSAAQLASARSLLEQASGADSFYVRKHVAALLAASPLDAVRDPATALRVALELAGGEIQTDPQMFETLAAAYAASGDFGSAIAKQRMALRKAEALAWDTRLMKQRLGEYRAGRAWRGALLPLPSSGAPGAQ